MRKTLKIHDSAIDRFQKNLQEEQDRITQNFLQTLQIRMEELNMSQSDMAYTLGKSRAYISKLFNKGQNLTIKTMVELSHSLDMKLAISARRMWVEVGQAPKATAMQHGWMPTDSVICIPTRIVCPPTGSSDNGRDWPSASNDNFELQELQRIC